MKVLYIDDNIEMRDFVSMLLEAEYDCDLMEAISGKEAVELLHLDSDIDFVIIEVHMKDGDGHLITEYFDQQKINVPILLISSLAKEDDYIKKILAQNENSFFLKKPFKDDDFFFVIEKIVASLDKKNHRDPSMSRYDSNKADWGGEKKYIKKAAVEGYDKDRFKRVRLKRFLNFTNVCCDAYIKIGNEKYVMLLSSNQDYDVSLIQKYHDKKIEYLYILKPHYKDFMTQFNGLVFSNLKQVKNMSTDIKIVAELTAFDTILNTAKELGVTNIVAEQVEKSINSVLDTVKSLPDMNNLLDKIMKGRSYISEHSLLLSYVAGQICMQTSWSSTSTLSKLTTAALFHDICLSGDDIAKIHTLKEAKDYDLSKDELEELKSHPIEAANLLNAGGNLFHEVDTIIIQHHEQPDGSGFPKGLGSLSISPLSCIFIIASDYVEELTNMKVSNKKIDLIKEEFTTKYSRGNFKKPLLAFLKCF